MPVLLPGKGPKFLRLRGLRPSRPQGQAERFVYYSGFAPGVSGSPTPTTLRVGETLNVSVLTRDEFGGTPALNVLTLGSSNTSIFSVNETAQDALQGTALATLTGLAPGTAKLVQTSSSPGVTPYELMTITVLNASALVFVQGAYAVAHLLLGSVEFDEPGARVVVLTDAGQVPIISVVCIPVDSRHAQGAAEPAYGVSDVLWSTAHGAVMFIPYGTTNSGAEVATYSGTLAVSMTIHADQFLAIGGDETVTVTARNSAGELLTGVFTVRVLLAATAEASQVA